MASAALPLLALLALVPPARAEPARECLGAPAAAGRWGAPLDRTVTVRGRQLTLRDALDRLAAGAGLRLSYSADLLPLDRRVCADLRALPAGDALAALLRGTGLSPVAVGADHVVLAPAPAPAVAADAPPAPIGVVPLERIVVTGGPSGTPLGALPVAVRVVRGSEAAGAGGGDLSRLLSATVPGVWLWPHSPAGLLLRYGSIRGASSFGVSYPKTFVDGIEVANPLVLTRLAPESVERIEVIRGPQGAALYGTDAISGVINVVTRQETLDGGAPRARMRSDLGLAASDYGTGSALAQDHLLALRAGRGRMAGGLDLGVGSMGEFVPGGGSRHLSAGAHARLTGVDGGLTATFRASSERAGTPIYLATGPLAGAPAQRAAATTEQAVSHVAGGITGRYASGNGWRHTAIVGLDVGRVSGLADDWAVALPALDAEPVVADGSASRASLRLASERLLELGAAGSASVSLALEHSTLREEAAPDQGGVLTRVQPGQLRERLVEWRDNTGLISQGTLSLRESLHLSGGLRLERNEGLIGDQFALLPMLGASLVGDAGPLSVKGRAAYGRGIRPARTATRQTVWIGSRSVVRMADLDPEEQEGVEFGVDLFAGSVASLQLTGFDQVATGLIQRVAVADAAPTGRPGGTAPRRLRYSLQNLGEITNRGWEAEATLAHGALSLSGGLARVESRVRRIAPGYTGDLRTGDRMLEVPRYTAGLAGSWAGAGWSASLSASRAMDWVNYDRLSLARTLASGARPPRDAEIGSWLRQFWRDYEGVTRLGAQVGVEVRPGVELTVTADNLLDRQRGEPDNATILPGRTLRAGFRARF